MAIVKNRSHNKFVFFCINHKLRIDLNLYIYTTNV